MKNIRGNRYAAVCAIVSVLALVAVMSGCSLHTYEPLEVVVVDVEDGSPVRGATVSVYQTGLFEYGSPGQWNAVTDEHGVAKLSIAIDWKPWAAVSVEGDRVSREVFTCRVSKDPGTPRFLEKDRDPPKFLFVVGSQNRAEVQALVSRHLNITLPADLRGEFTIAPGEVLEGERTKLRQFDVAMDSDRTVRVPVLEKLHDRDVNWSVRVIRDGQDQKLFDAWSKPWDSGAVRVWSAEGGSWVGTGPKTFFVGTWDEVRAWNHKREQAALKSQGK